MTAPRPFTDEPQALYCDEYALTMAQSFWRHGSNERTCFELVPRHLPDHRGYLVVAGLEQALAFLAGLRFTSDDLAYLASRDLFHEDFLAFLATLRFSGDVNAVAEGTVVGAETPLLQVLAPRIEATVVESALLATINHQTSVASKAARMVDVASGRPVWDFSLRRVHGPPAGLGVARASYIAGLAGTATEAAGKRLGIPTTGTMAHHYVLGFGVDGEQTAFEQFLRDYPERAVLLVDTYDTIAGVRHAIAASHAAGVELAGVRLDSGDLLSLSVRARRLLDEAGFESARILVSGDLDEYRIEELVRSGARIDSFGVGTALGTSSDAPALGGVYKLVAQCVSGEWRPLMKHSERKANDPGVHQVFRGEGADVLALAGESLGGTPLLQPVMTQGEAADYPSLPRCREHCREQLDALPEPVRRIHDPAPWPLHRSAALTELRRTLGDASIAT